MKPRSWILTASLVANGVLLVVLSVSDGGRGDEGSLVEARERVDPTTGDQASESVASTATRGEPSAASASFAALVEARDAIGLRDHLRGRGMSESLVRGIVSAVIEEKYQPRLDPRIGRGGKPYWQQSDVVTDHGIRQQMREQMLIRRQIQEEIESVVGPDPRVLDGVRYGFLPPEKAAAAYRIEADYDHLRQEHELLTYGYPLPSDRATLKLLEEERNCDLAALMTPEERAAFELRTSLSSGMVRTEYGWLLETEEEFKQFLAMQQEFMDSLDSPAGATVHDRYTAGRAVGSNPEAAEKLREEILEFLGPERAKQYARRRDPDYKRMEAAVIRFELPPDSTERMFDLRSTIAMQSQRIVADTQLSVEQKQAALGGLALFAREEFYSLMGPEAGQIFVERTLWMQWLEGGRAFAERQEGGVRPSLSASPP